MMSAYAMSFHPLIETVTVNTEVTEISPKFKKGQKEQKTIKKT